MSLPLDTALLHTFVAVADVRSFTGAGHRLNLSQSAVSAQIVRLEEQVGQALLVRNTRSVTVTAHGETLLGYARAMLNLSEEARARLGAGTVVDIKLRIGVSEDFAEGWLPDLMRRHGAARRGLRMDLVVDIGDSLFQRHANGEFDLVIGSRCAHSGQGATLWQEPLVWAFARHEPLPEGDVPLACFPDPCPYRGAAIKALALAGMPYRIACESPSVTGIRTFARAGIAIAPVPRSAIDDTLRELGPSEGLPELPDMEFVMMHDARMPAAVEFAATMRDETAARTGAGKRSRA
ncbi:MAG: LysR family transcriptional regulator [Burkholderia sp.]|jgi:DNA-binding transcriptional LysR family regulator|uniref:LysR substrate-binding domain-containing protein n=2 Tax=Burkholderia sp. TaxID=36773 RepID=UPI00258B70E5|nr:LysR substrate-binding domain-containing protein [Burkholderia sp.]MCA3779424.1 LysR family transcriptional regulator [Burkholderia sp.]MCA3784004.1 LysR family transcriptional regulator [Burkholderia sp.]MCA3796622.1 LysR family transcriptional regulator [Burkholderia sp.]MCA3804511.1 LysR family transcriptional regulator [Burkholderia sp.]MCA3811630.1 LysR family transcriptional regulator [Burkholderia sp.]